MTKYPTNPNYPIWELSGCLLRFMELWEPLHTKNLILKQTDIVQDPVLSILLPTQITEVLSFLRNLHLSKN